jgi:transposase
MAGGGCMTTEFTERREPASEVGVLRTELRLGLDGLRNEIKLQDENRRERLKETVRRLDELKDLLGEKIDLVRNTLAEEVTDLHYQIEDQDRRVRTLEHDKSERKGSKATLIAIAGTAGVVLGWLGSFLKALLLP